MSDNESEQSSSSEEILPPWGAIPAEIYLLEHYDPQSPQSPSEQAKALIKSYIRSGHEVLQHPLPPPPPPTPPPILSSKQLNFLKSWRSLSTRHVATCPSQIGNVWVRTHYSPETDIKHAALISDIDIWMAVDEDERILNDGSLYGGLGADWSGLFELLPELVVVEEGTRSGGWAGYQARIVEEGQALKEARARFQSGDEAVDMGSEGGDKAGEMIERYMTFLSDDELQQEVLDDLLSSVHKACVVNYVIIEDAESLEGEEGLLLLAFVDAWGRVVKSKRVSSEEAEQMGGMWLEAAYDETWHWEKGEIGKSYQGGRGWEDLLEREEGN